MDLREIGWESVDWIQLAQDRDRFRAFVNTMMNRRVLAPLSYYYCIIIFVFCCYTFRSRALSITVHLAYENIRFRKHYYI
jgi:hypothetical protein